MELQLQYQSSNEYSGLISFRIDLFDLLAVQGTFKSLLQHHSSKASILWCSAFFMVQLLYLYVTSGKTIALIIWNFVDKVMSLLFNVLSRLVRQGGLVCCNSWGRKELDTTEHTWTHKTFNDFLENPAFFI